MIPAHAIPALEALPRLPRLVALALYALADEWGEVRAPVRRARALLDVTYEEVELGIKALVDAGLVKDECNRCGRLATLLEWQGTASVSPTVRKRLVASMRGAR